MQRSNKRTRSNNNVKDQKERSNKRIRSQGLINENDFGHFGLGYSNIGFGSFASINYLTQAHFNDVTSGFPRLDMSTQ